MPVATVTLVMLCLLKSDLIRHHLHVSTLILKIAVPLRLVCKSGLPRVSYFEDHTTTATNS